MTANLYRHFNASGDLLYVGISKNALARIGGHKGVACWFQEIATVTIEHFPTRAEAMAAERAAVREERPRHNKILFRQKKKREKRTDRKTKFMKVRATEEEQAAWIAYAKQHGTDFSKLVREMMTKAVNAQES